MFWKTGNSGHISSWESKGLLGTIIKPHTSFNSLPPLLDSFATKLKVKFDGIRSKQDKITFAHGKTVNICSVYEINL